jgi:hypothetical protein
LKPATARIEAKAVPIAAGLSHAFPQTLHGLTHPAPAVHD